MSKKYLPVGLLCWLLGPASALADDAPVAHPDTLVNLLKSFSVSLAQGVADKNNLSNPASIQWVHSAAGDSTSIDAGITALYSGTEASSNFAYSLGPTAEYHRQTLTTANQKNVQAGLTTILIFGDVSKPDTVTSYFQGTAKYKRDWIVTGAGFFGKATWMPLLPAGGLGQQIGPPVLRFMMQPVIGVEYETASNVLKSGQGGHTARTYANLALSVFPFGKRLRSALQLTVAGTQWEDFDASSAYARLIGRSHRYGEFTATVWLDSWADNDHHVGLAFDRASGENPEQGLLKQNTSTVSLKVKF